MLNTVPSLRYGAGFLARTFCRLTKEMVDIAVNITSTQYVSPQHHKASMVCSPTNSTYMCIVTVYGSCDCSCDALPYIGGRGGVIKIA